MAVGGPGECEILPGQSDRRVEGQRPRRHVTANGRVPDQPPSAMPRRRHLRAASRSGPRPPPRGGRPCARPSRRLYVPPQVRSPRQTLLFRVAAGISDLDPTPATYLAGQTHPLYHPFITAAPWITALAPNVPAQCRACDPDGS